MSADPGDAHAASGVGRRWSDDREQEVLDAALAVLAEDGFAGMTIDAVAARARASKASLYRRWNDKAELVADAIRCRASRQAPPPETGDLQTDLAAFLRHLQRSFQGEDGALMLAMTAERVRHPDLAQEFDRRFVADKRRQMHRMLAAAVERGELDPDTDIDVLADLGPALILYRNTLRPGPVPDDLADRVTRQLLS